MQNHRVLSSLSHSGHLYSLAIPTLSSLTVTKALLFLLTKKHTRMCGLFQNRLTLTASSFTDPEGSDREECWYTYSWGSYFPVHQTLTCSASLGHRKYQSSCQGSPVGSICRKPLPRIWRVHVEFSLKKGQFCICLSWECTKILGTPKSSRVMATRMLAWVVQRIRGWGCPG